MPFEKQAVGGNLKNIGRPRIGLAGLIAEGPPPLVLVSKPVAVPVTNSVEPTSNAEIFVGKLDAHLLCRFFFGEFDMQGTTGINALVRDSDLLNLLQIEEPFTVLQRVQSRNANSWFCASRG